MSPKRMGSKATAKDEVLRAAKASIRSQSGTKWLEV